MAEQRPNEPRRQRNDRGEPVDEQERIRIRVNPRPCEGQDGNQEWNGPPAEYDCHVNSAQISQDARVIVSAKKKVNARPIPSPMPA